MVDLTHAEGAYPFMTLRKHLLDDTSIMTKSMAFVELFHPDFKKDGRVLYELMVLEVLLVKLYGYPGRGGYL